MQNWQQCKIQTRQPKTDFGFSDQKLVGIRQNLNRWHFGPKICRPELLSCHLLKFMAIVSNFEQKLYLQQLSQRLHLLRLLSFLLVKGQCVIDHIVQAYVVFLQRFTKKCLTIQRFFLKGFFIIFLYISLLKL